MKPEMRVELRNLLLNTLGPDDANMIVRALPYGDVMVHDLLARSEPLRRQVEQLIEVLQRHGAIGDELFFELIARYPLKAEIITDLAVWLLSPPPLEKADEVDEAAATKEDDLDYAAVVIHPGTTQRRQLAKVAIQWIQQNGRRWRAIIADAKVPMVRLADWAAAWELGRTLEQRGAVVSYESPEAGPRLPVRIVSKSGIIMVQVPAVDGHGGDYLMGMTPVTQAQYARVMGGHKGQLRRRQRPVGGVSYDDTLRFCARLTVLEGVEDAPYRPPTEAEWEWAGRAGAAHRYAGSNRWQDVAHAAASEPQDVARHRPNGWGLYDMSGNVHEWVALPCRSNAARETAVLKGGAFDSSANELQLDFRCPAPVESRAPRQGFRIARDIAADNHTRTVP